MNCCRVDVLSVSVHRQQGNPTLAYAPDGGALGRRADEEIRITSGSQQAGAQGVYGGLLALILLHTSCSGWYQSTGSVCRKELHGGHLSCKSDISITSQADAVRTGWCATMKCLNPRLSREAGKLDCRVGPAIVWSSGHRQASAEGDWQYGDILESSSHRTIMTCMS
jgi:hypothetical protein